MSDKRLRRHMLKGHGPVGARVMAQLREREYLRGPRTVAYLEGLHDGLHRSVWSTTEGHDGLKAADPAP